MKSINVVIALILFLMTILLNQYSVAQDIDSDNFRILAVIPVSKGSINKDVYHKFDALVPELKKISRNSIIKLECRYSGKPEREQDVLKAYQLAGRIEKYLREQHKLDLDLWITISLGQKIPKASPVLTIAVFANDIKPLNSIPIESDPDKHGK